MSKTRGHKQAHEEVTPIPISLLMVTPLPISQLTSRVLYDQLEEDMLLSIGFNGFMDRTSWRMVQGGRT